MRCSVLHHLKTAAETGGQSTKASTCTIIWQWARASWCRLGPGSFTYYLVSKRIKRVKHVQRVRSCNYLLFTATRSRPFNVHCSFPISPIVSTILSTQALRTTRGTRVAIKPTDLMRQQQILLLSIKHYGGLPSYKLRASGRGGCSAGKAATNGPHTPATHIRWSVTLQRYS